MSIPQQPVQSIHIYSVSKLKLQLTIIFISEKYTIAHNQLNKSQCDIFVFFLNKSLKAQRYSVYCHIRQIKVQLVNGLLEILFN